MHQNYLYEVRASREADAAKAQPYRQEAQKALFTSRGKEALEKILAMQEAGYPIETESIPAAERLSLSDDDILALIAKQARQREDSIAAYRKGGREDLVATS
jgi:uncharacterized protein YqeY